jgi:hypothetical protein
MLEQLIDVRSGTTRSNINERNRRSDIEISQFMFGAPAICCFLTFGLAEDVG